MAFSPFSVIMYFFFTRLTPVFSIFSRKPWSMPTVPGITYQVESTDDLASGTWTVVGAPVPGDGSGLDVGAPGSGGYLRVVIWAE